MFRRALILVILTLVVFFVVQQWFRLTVQWDGITPHVSEAPAAGQTSSPFAHLFAWWGGQDVGGLKLKLPFEVTRLFLCRMETPRDGGAPSTRGGQMDTGIYVGHVVKLPGSPPGGSGPGFTFFNDDVGMRVVSVSAVTTLNGSAGSTRENRVSISNTLQRLRARDLLLQQGDDVWIINYYAPEDDSDAEGVYTKIVNSAKPIAPADS